MIEFVHVQVVWGGFGQHIDTGPLERLLPEIEDEDVVLCACGYAQLAEASWPQLRMSRAARFAGRALELAAQVDDHNARTRAHLALAQTHWLELDLHGAHDQLRVALQSGRNSGDPWLGALSQSRLALTLFWLGRLEEAQSFALRAKAQTEETADFAEMSLALAALTCVAVALGEYEDAERHGDAAVAAIHLSRYTWSASLVFPALVTARLLQGDVLGARSALDQWTETVTSLGDTLTGDTIELIDLLIDRYAEASDAGQRTAGALPDWARGDQPVFIGGLQRVGALVELAENSPRGTAWPQWRTALEQAMEQGMVMTDGLVMLLPRVLADLSAREGRVDEAIAGYQTAIAKAEEIGSRPELARAELAVPRLIRDREPDAARTLATHSARLFAILSMPLYEKAAHELASPTERSLTPIDDLLRAAPSSRDTIVLLFTDVVDSTRLTEELGDEAYLGRLPKHSTSGSAPRSRCHGQPEDGIRPGDGVLAFFQRAEDAIECAALAHEHAAASSLQLHVGIHIGEVIRSRTGIHGGAVNLASARVCAGPAGLHRHVGRPAQCGRQPLDDELRRVRRLRPQGNRRTAATLPRSNHGARRELIGVCMPPMPVYYVGKGSQFRVLDMFDGTQQELYDETLARLEDTPLTELAQHRADEGGLTDQDVQHFENDWLGTWWQHKHVGLILRAGIRKAIQIALPNDDHDLLPIEALWVCADDGVFQVYVNEGPHQVTVIVYTPPPELYASQRQELEERIWVVKTRDDYDDTIPGPITRLNPEDEWPVLIERQLRYVAQTLD